MSVRDFSYKAIATWIALILAAACVTLAARHLGMLKPIELLAYDAFLGVKPTTTSTDPGIVIVEYRGDDEAHYGYPLRDRPLADLLERILAEEPVGIGLDLIRDRPEPGDDSAFRQLSDILDREPAIVGIVWSQAGEYGPPPVLADRLDRLGAVDIIEDPDKKVRRGLLFVDIDGKAVPSLALQLALRHANRRGIDGQYLDDQLQLGKAPFVPFEPNSSRFYAPRRDDRGPEGYQFLLSYPACRSGFPTFSVRDVLDGSARGAFAERIVLIGNTKRAYQDFRAVPLSCRGSVGGDMFGVHLHAQMTRQIIDQAEGRLRPIETTAQKVEHTALGEALDMLWIGVWALPGVVASTFLASPLLFVVACLSIVGLMLVLAVLAFVGLGWWLPILPPLMSFALCTALSIVFLLLITKTDREKALTLLGRLLSRKVAKELFKRDDLTPAGLAPQPMTATVMFSDIAGFTTISERLSESRLAPWLNQYLEAMVEIVERHGGVVEKFAGDGITAEFGVPEGHVEPEDIAADARAALDAALDMAVALDDLNSCWERQGLPKIGIRIGIHTGPLMVGAVGSEDRWQYSIIGDTANTAARLESFGKDDPDLACAIGYSRIFLSGVTLEHAGPGYRTDFVGDTSLRGKTQTVSIFRLESRIERDAP